MSARRYEWQQVRAWAQTAAEAILDGWGPPKNEPIQDNQVGQFIREYAHTLGGFNPVSASLTDMDKNRKPDRYGNYRQRSAWAVYEDTAERIYSKLKERREAASTKVRITELKKKLKRLS